MSILDIIVILAVLFVIYLIFSNSTTKNNSQDNKKEKFADFTTKNKDYSEIDDLLEHMKHNKNNKSKKLNIKKLKPFFNDITFHNDYRDVITAFNNIAPKQRQIFNIANIPVTTMKATINDVAGMVNDFIHSINKNIMLQVPNERNPNSGWDEAIPDPNVKSGWDKVQDELGLPSSIYNKPAGNNKIKLVEIEKAEKYETEDEIKFVIYFIIQKLNVNDQMIVKLSLVQDKRNLTDERLFFSKEPIEMKIVIEEIFVIGYLSNEGMESYESPADDFYNFEGLSDNNIMDQRVIVNELNKKYKQRMAEMQNRNALLGNDGCNLKEHLNYIANSDSYQTTRTIFDDFKADRTFS